MKNHSTLGGRVPNCTNLHLRNARNRVGWLPGPFCTVGPRTKKTKARRAHSSGRACQAGKGAGPPGRADSASSSALRRALLAGCSPSIGAEPEAGCGGGQQGRPTPGEAGPGATRLPTGPGRLPTRLPASLGEACGQNADSPRARASYECSDAQYGPAFRPPCP